MKTPPVLVVKVFFEFSKCNDCSSKCNHCDDGRMMACKRTQKRFGSVASGLLPARKSALLAHTAHAVGGGHSAVEGRDAASMRINLWVAQFGSDSFFKALRNKVLQALGFVVQFFERIVEDLVQKCLDQPMMAKNLKSAPSAAA